MQTYLAVKVPVSPEDVELPTGRREGRNEDRGCSARGFTVGHLSYVGPQGPPTAALGQDHEGAHLETRLGGLEEAIGRRMGGAEERFDTVESKMETIETRLEELARELRERVTSSVQGDRGKMGRRMTLTFGGWPRDSRSFRLPSTSITNPSVLGPGAPLLWRSSSVEIGSTPNGACTRWLRALAESEGHLARWAQAVRHLC